jgi:hypothetical protein
MHYVTPYSIVKRLYSPGSSSAHELSSKTLGEAANGVITDVIKLFLQSVDVDETWYRARYPDVAAAIDEGLFKSAKHHFIDSGYFEGRLPGEMAVEEDWYLSAYPDVSEGVKDRLFSSGGEHFKLYGYDEGRLPSPI